MSVDPAQLTALQAQQPDMEGPIQHTILNILSAVNKSLEDNTLGADVRAKTVQAYVGAAATLYSAVASAKSSPQNVAAEDQLLLQAQDQAHQHALQTQMQQAQLQMQQEKHQQELQQGQEKHQQQLSINDQMAQIKAQQAQQPKTSASS